MSDGGDAMNGGPARSRSVSPAPASEGRARSRSRSPDERRRRSRSSSRSRSRSRSRSPKARGGGDKTGGAAIDWRNELDRIYDGGILRRGDLDERIMDNIEALPPAEAACVITRLRDSDLKSVRNMNGFVVGIIRRVKEEGPDRGEGDINTLPKSVQNLLEDLIEDKKLERKDVDQRLVTALSKLSESNAEEALNRFKESVKDDVTIRSKQGFLMGIVRRLNPNGGGGRGGRGRGGGGDRYGGGGDRGGGDRYGGDRGGRRYDDRGGGGDRYRGGGGDRYGGGGGDRYGDRGGDRYGGDRGGRRYDDRGGDRYERR